MLLLMNFDKILWQQADQSDPRLCRRGRLIAPTADSSARAHCRTIWLKLMMAFRY